MSITENARALQLLWPSVPEIQLGDSWSSVHGRLMVIYGHSRTTIAERLGWKQQGSRDFQPGSTDVAPDWPTLVVNAGMALGIETSQVESLFLVANPLLGDMLELVEYKPDRKTGIARAHQLRWFHRLGIHVRNSPACPECMTRRPGAQQLEWRFGLFPFCREHKVTLVSHCLCGREIRSVDQVVGFYDRGKWGIDLTHACRCGATWNDLGSELEPVAEDRFAAQEQIRQQLHDTRDPQERLWMMRESVLGVITQMNTAARPGVGWKVSRKPPTPGLISQYLMPGLASAERLSKHRVTVAPFQMGDSTRAARFAASEPSGEPDETTSAQSLWLASIERAGVRSFQLPGGVPPLYPVALTGPEVVDPLANVLEALASPESRSGWLYNRSRGCMSMYVASVVNRVSIRRVSNTPERHTLRSHVLPVLHRFLRGSPDHIQQLAECVVDAAVKLEELAIDWELRRQISESPEALDLVLAHTDDVELARYWLVNEFACRFIPNARDAYTWTHMCPPEMVRELHANEGLLRQLELVSVSVAS